MNLAGVGPECGEPNPPHSCFFMNAILFRVLFIIVVYGDFIMTLVGEPVVLPRSETEKIWVSVSEFRGFAGLDIRIYYNAGEVDWRPTKKGVRISLELKDQLIAAIEKVVAQYEAATESGDVGEAKD
jgi:hypothetical protein